MSDIQLVKELKKAREIITQAYQDGDTQVKGSLSYYCESVS